MTKLKRKAVSRLQGVHSSVRGKPKAMERVVDLRQERGDQLHCARGAGGRENEVHLPIRLAGEDIAAGAVRTGGACSAVATATATVDCYGITNMQ